MVIIVLVFLLNMFLAQTLTSMLCTSMVSIRSLQNVKSIANLLLPNGMFFSPKAKAPNHDLRFSNAIFGHLGVVRKNKWYLGM